jgi:N-acetylmuramoyl-L-alanine amidase
VKNIVRVSLFSILIVLASFTTLEQKQYKLRKVVINAGHGGKDPGTHGRLSKEKDVVLKVALELESLIKKHLPDVEVVLTRKTDKFMELHDIASMSNKSGADLFISIHCNSNPNKAIVGSETYVMGLTKSAGNLEVAKRENSVILLEEDHKAKYEGFDPNSTQSHILFSLYQNAFIQNSLNLAGRIETQFKSRVGRVSRGVKQAGFLVLWRTNMPSVLVELGFLSNEREEKDLNDELKQSYMASAIFRAFRDYKEELESMN